VTSQQIWRVFATLHFYGLAATSKRSSIITELF